MVLSDTLVIPGPNGEAITGILTHAQPLPVPRNTKLIVIMHGHAGHKDYCYQKQLAESSTEYDAFRFDFRGCGDSAREIVLSDTTNTSFKSMHAVRCVADDIEDMAAVVRYLRSELGYRVWSLVGHSRGSLAGFYYVLRHDPTIPMLVNVSARYSSGGLRDRVEAAVPGGLTRGSYIEHWRFKGRTYDRHTPAAEIHYNSTLDVSEIKRLPAAMQVLSVFGSVDHIVPIADAALFANDLADRHTLRIITGADHNFQRPATATVARGHYNTEVCDVIHGWLSMSAVRTRFYESNRTIASLARWKHVEGVANFRDLGGYTEHSGTAVRTGFIYRCANPSQITEQGTHMLRDTLNVTIMFDLRSNPEVTKNGFAVINGVTRHHVPVFRDEDYSPIALAKRHAYYQSGTEGFLQAYSEILKNAGPAYRAILLHIRDSPTTPFAIYCTAGKDRTGLICAFILVLAGVDVETVCMEYSMTTEGLADEMPRLRRMLMAEGSKSVAEEGLLSMLSSTYDTMRQTLEMVDRVYGGVEQYLALACNLTPADLSCIRTNLLTLPSSWIYTHRSLL